jgi:AmmeMemoRadiSam system protein B
VNVRAAAVAGSWYSANAARLTTQVARYLEQASAPSLPGPLVGLIAPHAGLEYSGPVAAYAYKTLAGRPRLTAVLVGPSHRVAFRGVSVYANGAFDMPLGRIPIDEALAARLVGADPSIVDAPLPHRDEHSLEMQLPFLKHVVPELSIVPMLMGAQTREEVEALAPALAAAVQGRDDVVLVASSDLSHYNPASIANELDAHVVDDVARFDAESLMRRLEQSHEHACGGGPMVAVMMAARALGATQATVLRYADSGDAGRGDKSHVVGYMAAALTRAR